MKRLLGCILAVAIVSISLRDARPWESEPGTLVLPSSPDGNGVDNSPPLIAPLAQPIAGASLTISPQPEQASQSFAWLGASSCSASACHGAVDHVRGTAPGSIGNEHQTWVRYDPHTKAHAVLLTDRSKQIEKLYRSLSDLKDARPELDAECLNCHVGQGVSEARKGPEFVHLDGVSCEGCHGAAERYVNVHYATYWKGFSPEQKASYGMRDMKAIPNRAGVCVDCHVGKPGSEVNHDLIAAGHPRLRFEFGSFHAIYPKHWDSSIEKRSRPDFEAKAWAVGQLVSAKASLKLLKWRADNAPKHPWPEFTEYDCASCHQELSGPYSKRAKTDGLGLPWDAWKPLIGEAKPRQGTKVPWGTWYFSQLPLLDISGLAPGSAREIAPLAVSMTNFKVKPAEASANAEKAIQGLDNAIMALDNRWLNLPELQATARILANSSQGFDLARWDQVTQLYLGLAALHNGMADQNPGLGMDLETAIQALTDQLKIKPNTDAPVGPDPDKVRGGLRAIEQRIGY